MAPAGALTPRQEPGEETPGEWPAVQAHGGEDIELAPEDTIAFLTEAARVYGDQAAMELVLLAVGFPRENVPVMVNPLNAWQEIFHEFDNGIADQPYRRLLVRALTVYRSNRVFRDLGRRYLGGAAAGTEPQHGPERAQPQPTAPPAQTAPTAPAPAPAPTTAPRQPTNTAAPPTPPAADHACHVIVRVGEDDDRRRAEDVLHGLGLDPLLVWMTAHAASFRVATADPEALRRLLERTDLGWTLVPPGQHDYLLHVLYVDGPDGRRFRLTDAPAHQSVGNVAGEILGQYPPFRDSTRPTVVDQVDAEGQGHRLDPEETLHDAGVRDGDRLRVGFQATAGAVNPRDREDALYRVRNQITAYAEAREGFAVDVNWMPMPTEYVIEFRRRSFAPDPDGGADPVETDRPHRVLIQPGADFPMAPPHVFWLTQIFHPNVYPTYDCELARARPESRGLVCLGALSESYQPSLDFGELCQTLVDMAGFRNYGLMEQTGEVDADGRPRVRADFYDGTAARWVWDHPDRIAAIGGRVPARRGPERSRYRNVVEAVEP